MVVLTAHASLAISSASRNVLGCFKSTVSRIRNRWFPQLLNRFGDRDVTDWTALG